MGTINNLQNTRRPSTSYLSGNFKAIFQREATSNCKETNTRPHREAAGDLLPDRQGSVKAKSGAARAPSQLYTSLILPHCCADTPLSPHESTRTMRLKDPSLPGEIDTPPQDRDKGFKLSKTSSAKAITAISGHHLKHFGPAWRGEAARRPSPACFSPSLCWCLVVLGIFFDPGLNAASASKMLIRPEGGFFPLAI